MRSELNTSLPFIAIRTDEQGDEFMRTMGEYFCNPLAEDLIDVKVSTGGWFSDDFLGVIESVPTDKPTFVVPAGEAVRFVLSTWDEYREMVCHWTVRYRTATTEVEQIVFATFKNLSDTQNVSDVPVLGGPGYIVPRKIAD